MRKLIVAECQARMASVAWLSFQPDGSISFGLNDRAFYAPRLGAQIGIFNAYNRVRLEYQVARSGSGLKPILNPHFTYHPSNAQFHLTGNGDADVFTGIMDPSIILHQQSALEWIRATTRAVSTLSEAKQRPDGIETETWIVPVKHPDVSLRIALDLLLPAPVATTGPWLMHRVVTWHRVMARVIVDSAPSQEATLSWFHEY